MVATVTSCDRVVSPSARGSASTGYSVAIEYQINLITYRAVIGANEPLEKEVTVYVNPRDPDDVTPRAGSFQVPFMIGIAATICTVATLILYARAV